MRRFLQGGGRSVLSHVGDLTGSGSETCTSATA